MKFLTSKSVLRAFLSAMVSALISVNAWADYSCLVNVLSVLPYSTGVVNVLHTGRGDYTVVCSLTADYTSGQTVKPETCAMWTAILLQAKKNNTKVNFYFPGTGSCETLPVYGASPVPIYIGPIIN
jgi:hypothetical protein